MSEDLRTHIEKFYKQTYRGGEQWQTINKVA